MNLLVISIAILAAVVQSSEDAMLYYRREDGGVGFYKNNEFTMLYETGAPYKTMGTRDHTTVRLCYSPLIKADETTLRIQTVYYPIKFIHQNESTTEIIIQHDSKRSPLRQTVKAFGDFINGDIKFEYPSGNCRYRIGNNFWNLYQSCNKGLPQLIKDDPSVRTLVWQDRFFVVMTRHTPLGGAYFDMQSGNWNELPNVVDAETTAELNGMTLNSNDEIEINTFGRRGSEAGIKFKLSLDEDKWIQIPFKNEDERLGKVTPIGNVNSELISKIAETLPEEATYVGTWEE